MKKFYDLKGLEMWLYSRNLITVRTTGFGEIGMNGSIDCIRWDSFDHRFQHVKVKVIGGNAFNAVTKQLIEDERFPGRPESGAEWLYERDRQGSAEK
jgi:hypothetical protein